MIISTASHSEQLALYAMPLRDNEDENGNEHGIEQKRKEKQKEKKKYQEKRIPFKLPANDELKNKRNGSALLQFQKVLSF